MGRFGVATVTLCTLSTVLAVAGADAPAAESRPQAVAGEQIAAAGQAAGPSLSPTPPLTLVDRFGREFVGRDIELVDWDGQLANPALKLMLRVAAPVRLPLQVRLSASSPRLMFNLYSEVTAQGPRKTLFVERADEPVPFWLAIFPDRDGIDDQAWLRIETTNPYGVAIATVYRVHVHDQDRGGVGTFGITFDYSHDRTGFFASPAAVQVFEQAAKDWGYCFEGEPGMTVGVGEETAWMWEPDGFRAGREIQNTLPFSDYLLYAHGMQHPDMRSGATASDRSLSGFQVVAGGISGLRRSGTVSIETRGNWHPDGWHFSGSDDEWLISRNGWGDPTDFYSVAHHEIGHALLFHESIPAFTAHVHDGQFVDDALRAYLGDDARVSDVNHFEGVIDPLSRVGAFGNEYGGDFPLYRWLITKTDLLVARACGYRLRPNSALEPLAAGKNALWRLSRAPSPAPAPPEGGAAEAFASDGGLPTTQTATFDLGVRGGVPPYCVRVVSGELPAGFELDSFRGELRALNPRAGSYELALEIRDQDPHGPVVAASVRIEVVP